MDKRKIKKVVREKYGEIARAGGSCCGSYGQSGCCCGGSQEATIISKKIGYSSEDLMAVPEGANLGLGCGNPVALASLKPGEAVLDLGSGAGFDCFLAASRVGNTGKVIGVDMTPEMLERARENARKGNYLNVEFRLGEIENLPVADNSVDVIISNCVINLSPDKSRVFSEAYRVLKPGGRLMVSDIVLTGELPESIRESVAAYAGCIAGASLKPDYLKYIESAGFKDITVVDETPFLVGDIENDPLVMTLVDNLETDGEQLGKIVSSIISIKVSAKKPS